ncbi:FAD:protein FMN transferase [Nocardioides sp. zg-536]|uniref:FAD:protein FMN transferase n=1 Tax=Nocardioides faecalis TaxID=2803858 RepID=A0A939BUK9_9ACTN|nr:FAD:protein FMN transferase [Nocardioides faecalis]MBM9458981.1 FAD:protein FMN transferase [Nocardioides faecalis]QVI57250.1 FAD:protein FMN transferase [Nocardioides faecalis]
MAGSWTFEALGTGWEVDADLTPAEQATVRAALEDFDRTWSRFRPDSCVAELARGGGSIPLTEDTERLLDLYDVLAELTGGAVSPLVGDSLAALGYDAGYSLVGGNPRPAPPVSALQRSPGSLALREPGMLDIGAAGKGLAVDLVARLLDTMLAHTPGAARSVDASGDLWNCAGHRPLRVALEHPDDPRLAVGTVELAPGTALCASAVNRRAWGTDLHHVLDARTGLPVRDVVASWAIGDSAMVADGAATALFFAPPGAVVEALGLTAAVCITGERRVLVAGRLPGEVFA